MKAKNKVDYMRIGLGIAGIGVEQQTAELIVLLYEAIQKKKGKYTMGETLTLQRKVADKYKKKEKPKPSE